MDNQKLSYIEEIGIFFEQLGMTRMSGRAFGYMIVSDKSEVSFADIQSALKASKGSISGTTKQLITIGFIEPITKPGDRKTYFKISEKNVGDILKSRIELFVKFSSMLKKGNQLKKKDDNVSAWLHEITSFYDWIGDEIEKILDRWEVEKEKILTKQ